MAKKTIKLSETQFRKMVAEAINELDWKTYANAANKVKTNYNSDDEYKMALKLFNNLGYDESEVWKVNGGDTFRQCLANARKIILQKTIKNFDRHLSFQNAAEDRFNKDFGFEDETGKVNLTTGHWDGGGTSWYANMTDRNGNRHGSSRYFITSQDFYGQNGQHTPGKWCVGTVGWAGAVPASPDFDTPEEAQTYADEHNMSTEKNAASDNLKKAYYKAKEETTKYDPYDGTSSSLNNPRYSYEKGKGWQFTESKLNKIVAESVKKVLKEYEGDINTPNMSEQLISQFANLILNATDENTANSLATEIYWSFGDANKGMDAIEGLLMRFEPDPNKAAQINNTDFPQ